jgi:hypothetical protein
MPGREKPLHLQSASDLWGTIIGFPLMGGILLAAILVASAKNAWEGFWVVLLVGAFLFPWSFLGIPERLLELARRGEWVPRSTVRHPRLVGATLTVLGMVVPVAIVFGMMGIMQLTRLIS